MKDLGIQRIMQDIESAADKEEAVGEKADDTYVGSITVEETVEESDTGDDNQMVGDEPLAGLGYSTSESDSDNEDDHDRDEQDEDEDPLAVELVEAMEESIDHDPHDLTSEDRVTVSKEVAERIRLEIWKEGAARFIQRLIFSMPLEFSASQVLASLGFPLPKTMVEKCGERFLAMYVHPAIRYSMKTRQRLSYPHNLDEFCDTLRKARNVIVLTGAGISTSLGIPDFRSKTGLYSRLEHLGIGDPQEVFSMGLFREDPSIFFSIAKDILPEGGKFSPTHAFIKLLQDQGKLLRNYTQNIDNLEHSAGIEEDKLCQCHGSFATATCVTCRYSVPGETIYKEIRASEVAHCPICKEREQQHGKKRKRKGSQDSETDDENDYMADKSEGIMKPDITFFGEALPDRFDRLLFGHEGQPGDAKQCDLLICIGTSLQVAPVADIVRVIGKDVPQIYISRMPTRHNKFDVTFLGNCDDVVELIAEKMDWKLDHEMNQRLSASRLPDLQELTYPDGKIVYDEEEATYKFLGHDGEQPVESEQEDEDEKADDDDDDEIPEGMI